MKSNARAGPQTGRHARCPGQGQGQGQGAAGGRRATTVVAFGLGCDDPPVIIAIGTDLVDLARIERLMTREQDRFLARILTPTERAYCERQGNPLPLV